MTTTAKASALSLGRLARKRLYFAHQSVGANILEGVRDVLSDSSPRPLRIVQTRELATLEGPVFAHSRIGRNGDPGSKLEEFTDVVSRSAPAGVDVALLKFCFVDFDGGRDAGDVFRRYAETFARLRDAFPGTTFVHVTVPLTGNPAGLRWAVRNVVKRVVGRHVRSPEDNRTICAFNALLRDRYAGREPVFDLAALESTRADGTWVSVEDGGLTLFSLASEYTSDGGHLNETGRLVVARALLQFLEALPT
jgi:hypothetical protein